MAAEVVDVDVRNVIRFLRRPRAERGAREYSILLKVIPLA